MATSAFKSTTKRPSASQGSSSRRSRSLSRPHYEINARSGKFVNTERGSAAAAFPEISLDDLALEFFSSSSLNESDCGGKEEKVSRWAADTASSRSRGRSVSRSRVDTTAASDDVTKASRRRRSLSTARYHRSSNSQSEFDHSRSSSNRCNVKTPMGGNNHVSLLPNTKTSSNRKLGRSRSHKDPSVFLDGYSSHSSALTDEESKDARIVKNGSEKIIRTVYARNKADHPAEVAGGELYEAMKKELKYAVDEIRTELNQAVGRSHIASGHCLQSDAFSAPQDSNGTRGDYETKLEKAKADLSLKSHEECDLEASRKIKELQDSRFSSAAERPLRGRKRSTDRSRSSKKLIEEADRIIEDFVSNVEDSDLSSFNGERSDCSSLGGMMRSRNAVIRETEYFKSPAASASCPAEMDGIHLPWLQWETSGDCALSGKNNVTPTALKWDSDKAIVSLHDPSGYSASSHGSWSPGLFNSPAGKGDIIGRREQVSNTSCRFDMEEYLRLEKAEKLVFEMYRERNRISSGGIFLCAGLL